FPLPAQSGIPSVHPLTGTELRASRRLQREQAPGRYLFLTERRAPMSAVGPDQAASQRAEVGMWYSRWSERRRGLDHGSFFRCQTTPWKYSYMLGGIVSLCSLAMCLRTVSEYRKRSPQMRQCHWSRAKMYGRHSELFGSSLGSGIFKQSTVGERFDAIITRSRRYRSAAVQGGSAPRRRNGHDGIFGLS